MSRQDLDAALGRFKSDIIRAWIAALAVQTVVIVGAFAVMLHFGR